MEGWHAGREYPIATQTVTEELRSLGMRVFNPTEGLLAPGIRETLDFLLSGTVQPIRFEIHDIPAGNYSEAQYRLNLKVVDARSCGAAVSALQHNGGVVRLRPDIACD